MDLPEIDLEKLPELGEMILAQLNFALPPDRMGPGYGFARAHAIAIKNWLGKYRPSASATAQDNVRGYQEAYHHLRELDALPQALMVKRVALRIRMAVARQRWQRFEEALRREQR